MPKNFFEGATMDSSVVSLYYPDNMYFDHFVFQQVLANPNAADNNYSLCVYAVFINGDSKSCQLTTLRGMPPKQADAGVQYANMKLYPAGLAKLYPNGVNQDPITIVPTVPYAGNSNYMVYAASTPSIIEGGTVTLNPSPPA